MARFLQTSLPAFLPLRAAAPLTSPHDGPLRWNASGGLRRCSSGNGSGRTRPRRGFRWWFMRYPPQRSRAGRRGGSCPGEGANATGPPADAPLTRERARSARLCGRQHPAVLGENGLFRPVGTMAPARRGQGVGETARLAGPVLWEKRLSTVPAASLLFAHTLAARCSGRWFLPS